jgi:hypothetical protein
MGIEPTFEAWEAPVLPLNYTRDDSCNSLPRRTAGTGTSSGYRIRDRQFTVRAGWRHHLIPNPGNAAGSADGKNPERARHPHLLRAQRGAINKPGPVADTVRKRQM